MEYITNKRGEQVTLDEFVTWDSHRQHTWSSRGRKRDPETIAKMRAYYDTHPEELKMSGEKARDTFSKQPPEVQQQFRKRLQQKAKERWANTTPEELEAIKNKIRKTTLATIARKKRLGIKVGCGWDGKTPEQREAIKQKIREKAIINAKIKWQDPDYRERHRKGMEKARAKKKG